MDVKSHGNESCKIKAYFKRGQLMSKEKCRKDIFL